METKGPMSGGEEGVDPGNQEEQAWDKAFAALATTGRTDSAFIGYMADMGAPEELHVYLSAVWDKKYLEMRQYVAKIQDSVGDREVTITPLAIHNGWKDILESGVDEILAKYSEIMLFIDGSNELGDDERKFIEDNPEILDHLAVWEIFIKKADLDSFAVLVGVVDQAATLGRRRVDEMKEKSGVGDKLVVQEAPIMPHALLKKIVDAQHALDEDIEKQIQLDISVIKEVKKKLPEVQRGVERIARIIQSADPTEFTFESLPETAKSFEVFAQSVADSNKPVFSPQEVREMIKASGLENAWSDIPDASVTASALMDMINERVDSVNFALTAQ